jgi:septal ring factor EnvC (AmiA/AmiB activator)
MSGLKVINRSKCNAACREAAVELERAKANIEYFDRHRETLLQRHPDQWVAIAGGKLAGHNRELTRLIESLQRRGIDPRTSLVQFMSSKKRLYVL